jgi:hypothetical protein
LHRRWVGIEKAKRNEADGERMRKKACSHGGVRSHVRIRVAALATPNDMLLSLSLSPMWLLIES